ncbi:MAG: RDD family protein [Actinobacteria bacterium]|nr:RDD family protein [Actinomycetota bacterium]
MSETPSYSPPAGTGPSGPRSGFWRRFAAAFLDGIVIGIVASIMRAFLDANAANGLGTLIGLFYYTYFEGSSGQTPGKKALGIRVIDFSGGGPIGYGRAFIRYIGRFVSAIVLLLGYLWMLWDKEKQTWHDKFANSVVVPESAYPVEKWP